MSKFTKPIVFIFLIVLVLSLLPHAASASNLSIEPIRQELTLAAGKTFSSQLYVRNNSKKAETVHISAESFNIVNEEYDYGFAASQDVSKWVLFDQTSLNLKPNELGKVNYGVSLPGSLEPGEKYIVIFASASEEPTVIDRAGQLLYITVPGNTTKKANVLQLNMQSLASSSQIRWDLRIHSTGTAHFRSQVTVTVKNLFGKIINTDTNEHLILPDTIRHLSSKVTLGRWPGIYKVSFLVGQGDDPAFRQTKWVLYAPLIPTIISLIILVFIISEVVLFIRKRYHKKID